MQEHQLLSSQQLNHKKSFNCLSCGNNLQENVHVVLSCDHRFCYQCFIAHLKRNRKPSNHCPICNGAIDDNIIRCSLSPVDYIYYLEHNRDNLRKALKKKVRNGSSQEFSSDTHSELHRLYDLSYVKNSLPFECLELLKNCSRTAFTASVKIASKKLLNILKTRKYLVRSTMSTDHVNFI